MAGTSNEKGKKLYESKEPQFFKLVIHPLDQGIRIPPPFMRKYGDRLDKKVVILKDPAGAAWPVKLLQIDGGTWLYKGLKEFGEFHSIQKNNFLVFRLQGNSQFLITIFDETAVEVDYPIKLTRERQEVATKRRQKPEEDDDDYSIEILGESRGKKKVKVDQQAEKHETINPVGMSTALANGLRILRERMKEGGSEGTSRAAPPQSSPPVCSKKENLEANHERAKSFKSENPFFICSMRPTYCSTSYCLNIPADFVRKHLGGNHGGHFELRLPERRAGTWPVNLIKKRYSGKFCGGWRKFASENGVVEGNACVFELVEGTETFVVHIYR